MVLFFCTKVLLNLTRKSHEIFFNNLEKIKTFNRTWKKFDQTCKLYLFSFIFSGNTAILDLRMHGQGSRLFGLPTLYVVNQWLLILDLWVNFDDQFKDMSNVDSGGLKGPVTPLLLRRN